MVEAKIATEENKAHADAMSHVITEEEYKKLGKSLFAYLPIVWSCWPHGK